MKDFGPTSWKWSEGRKKNVCLVLVGDMVQVRQTSIRGVRSIVSLGIYMNLWFPFSSKISSRAFLASLPGNISVLPDTLTALLFWQR